MKDDQLIEMLRSTIENVQANQRAIIALQQQVSALQQESEKMEKQFSIMKIDQESQSLKTRILNNRVINYLEGGVTG